MHTLGIDLGGTFARAALVDASGSLLATEKRALADRSPASVVETIAQAAAAVLGGYSAGAIGVGVAGQLADGGFVRVGPNLGWRDVPFGQLLATRLGAPVQVFNDLACAAWGELRAGAGKGCDDVWVVFVGSGVGSAIISRGKLLRGATGVAGEIGHSKVVRDGRLCGCGERGCLEAYVGGHNLIVQMAELVRAGESPVLARLCGEDVAKLTPAILEQAVELGDVAASTLHQAVAGHLGLSIANQVTVLNPARVILGGGVLVHAARLRRAIPEAVARYANASSRAAVQIVDAALGDDSGLIGAGLLATMA